MLFEFGKYVKTERKMKHEEKDTYIIFKYNINKSTQRDYKRLRLYLDGVFCLQRPAETHQVSLTERCPRLDAKPL